MRERLTADDLFSHILILRPVDKRIFLLLEGDSDHAALRAHIDESEINVIPGYGKGIIEPAMSLVNNHAVPKVAALLDRDFGTLLSGSTVQSNVFFTDRYDLDATIFFSSDLCDRMAFNFGDGDLIKGLISDLGCSDLASASANLALAVGVLRLISVRDGLRLNLREFPIGEAVRADCRSVDLEALASLALKKGPQSQPKRPRELVAEIRTEMASVTEPYAYCSGHDLARALSVILRKRGNAFLKPDTVERALRSAFGCAEIRATRMYTELAVWAQQIGKRIWTCDPRI
jgi:hypothetical protein